MVCRYEKDSLEFNFFKEYYQFIQNYAIPESKDTFWDEVSAKADELCKKYGRQQFFIDLVMAHLKELERKAKGGSVEKK